MYVRFGKLEAFIQFLGEGHLLFLILCFRNFCLFKISVSLLLVGIVLDPVVAIPVVIVISCRCG